jgi:hypothetical protein
MLDKPTKIYLWTEIERILFEPTSDKDKKKWFKQYHKFALSLWGKEPEFPTNTEYELFLDEDFQMFFRTPFELPKFSVDFSYKNSIQSFHYDNSEYFSKIDLVDVFKDGILDKAYHRKVKQVNPTRGEIEGILKSMIVHPDLHIHYYKETFRELKADNAANYIRLGFNTNNPFMFLYHLAFQLCDYKTDYKSSKKKQEEFKRIVDLVEKNLQNRTKVPSGKLFGLQR